MLYQLSCLAPLFPCLSFQIDAVPTELSDPLFPGGMSFQSSAVPAELSHPSVSLSDVFSVQCCTSCLTPLFPCRMLFFQINAVPAELSHPFVSLSNVFSLMPYQLSYLSPLFPCLQSVAIPTELSFPSVSMSSVCCCTSRVILPLCFLV